MKIKYTCGCRRRVDDKAVTFCDQHAHLRFNYAAMLADKRRLKEVIRQTVRLDGAGAATRYQKRLLCAARKAKRGFWDQLEECPAERPRPL